MNHDGPTAQDRCRIRIVSRSNLVVVNHRITGRPVPNFDAEAVITASSIYIAVNTGQEKPVVSQTVNRSNALELGSRTGDDQPLVGSGIEIQITGVSIAPPTTSCQVLTSDKAWLFKNRAASWLETTRRCQWIDIFIK